MSPRPTARAMICRDRTAVRVTRAGAGTPGPSFGVCRPSGRCPTMTIRVTIRVRPGASRTRVGGEHDGALVVAVTKRAVDGRATQAALEAVADAVGVRP